MKLGSAESQQQVPDLTEQVLEGSEELGEVRVVPLDVEGAVREDEETAHNCESGDCEHKAVTTKIIISSVRIPRVIVMVREVMKYDLYLDSVNKLCYVTTKPPCNLSLLRMFM